MEPANQQRHPRPLEHQACSRVPEARPGCAWRWPCNMSAFILSLAACLAIAVNAGAADKPDSEPVAPPAILRMADAYLSSPGRQDKPGGENSVRRSYLQEFFSGFVNPKGTINGGTSTDHVAFQAGQEYRHNHPDKLKETMEGFGFTATNADGVWSVEFERSAFRMENHSGRDWWLTELPDPESAQVRDRSFWDSSGPIHISGFLSPKGNYGHLGGYDHRFFATNISGPKMGQPQHAADGSQPSRSVLNSTPGAAGSRR